MGTCHVYILSCFEFQIQCRSAPVGFQALRLHAFRGNCRMERDRERTPARGVVVPPPCRATPRPPVVVPPPCLVTPRPPRWGRAGRTLRQNRRVRGAIYKLWESLVETEKIVIGIGRFRSTLTQWVNRAQRHADRDLDEPSRGPLESDAPSTVDTCTLDSLQNALANDPDPEAQSENAAASTRPIVHIRPPPPARRPTLRHTAIVEQASLTDGEMRALYGMGHRVMMQMSGGAIAGGQPLTVDVGTGRRQGIRETEAATPEEVDAEAVVAALAVADNADLQCGICLDGDTAELGTLMRLSCGHRFHEFCITGWEETHRNTTCPHCRGPIEREVPGRAGELPAWAQELFNGLRFGDDRRRPATSVESYRTFIGGLAKSNRLTPGAVLGGFPTITQYIALTFARTWLQQRPCQKMGVGSLLELFGGLDCFPSSHEGAEAVQAGAGTEYFIKGNLKPEHRAIPDERTAEWDVAYHGSHLGAVYCILDKHGLQSGPNKKNNKRGKKVPGVYCHKHGTRRKCAGYMTYFQFPGLVAAAMFELRVCPASRRTCGDQWACPPDKVQITNVWFHIVPNEEVVPALRLNIAPAWELAFELNPNAFSVSL